MNKFYNCDCMDLMKKYSDKYFDLAVVDPPYGIGEDGLKNHSRSKLAFAKKYKIKNWDIIPEKNYFDELFRVSKNQIIFGGNFFIDFLKSTSCFLVWDKNNGKNDFADCELAWTSFKTACRLFKYTWNGMIQENMKNKEIRIHPTQKPVALYRWILQNYANKNNIILDTHVGSGSSLIACIDEKLNYIGCEDDIDYYNDAKKRIEEYKKQLKLF